MANPFSPLTTQSPIAVSTISATTALSSDLVGDAIRIANSGPTTVFIALGDSAITATNINLAVLPLESIVLGRSPGGATHIAAIALAAPSTIYVATGNGGI